MNLEPYRPSIDEQIRPSGASSYIARRYLQLFITCVLLAGFGSLLFAIGLGAAFEKAGNWADQIATAGIFCIGIAAGVNSLLASIGIIVCIKHSEIRKLVCCSFMVAIVTLWGVSAILRL